MIVISSVDTDWSISNANGSYSPSTNNLVEGIVSRPIRGSVSPSGVKALEYVVFVEGNDLKLDLPNTTSAFISQGSAVVQVSTSGKNSGTVTITKDTVSVDDPNVNVKVASADLVADIAGNNTVIAITEKQLNVSVESSTGQTFTVAVNQETPQVSARAVDPVGSSAPTNFAITTQTSDNQVQVREVARDGSETVVTKQATALTDLNNTDIQLAPALQVSTVKPGLPPLEDRDLKNPEYKADESFVPKTGLVVSKLAEVVVLNAPTTVPVKNATVPEVMNSFGPTTLVPASTTTVPPTTVPPSSTTTTPTTLPTTTTTVKSTTTTVKPVVRTTTTTTTVPPTTTTSSTTTTTSSTTTTTSSTTTTTAPPIYSAPPDTTTTTSSTTTTTIAATAPSAPTSVTGTSGNAQVSLSWYAPSSNGGAAITDYVVQYSTSASSGFETFSDGTSTATTATVTGLTNNTPYYFKVAAVNSVGTSSYSTVSSGVTPLVPYFNAVSNLTAVANANGSVDLAWSAPTASNLEIYGYSVGFYDLDVIGGTASGGWGVWTNQGTYYSLSTELFSGGNPVTTGYGPVRFGIKAMSGQCVGVGSGSCTYGPETYVDATVLDPTAPSSVAGTSGNAEVSLSWTAPSSNGGATITDYVVQYSTSASSGFATFSDGTSTTASATVTGLTNGTIYYFKVAAVNSAGTNAYSVVSSGVTTLSTRTLTIDSASYLSSYRMAVAPPTIASTASAGTGTKTYSSSTTSVCTVNSSSGLVAFVSVGTCTIGASIAADSSYNTATASAVSFSVVYAVGDTGPSGGIVFYVQASGGTFTSTGSSCGSTCKYLEAAPTGWIVASTPAGQTNCSTPGTSTVDPICAWSGNTSTAIGATARGTAIGTGYANTSAIIAQTNGGSTAGNAATVSRAYQGGSKTDWFLPSTLELNQLCRYAWNLTVDNTATTCTDRTGTIRTGFSTDNWWSSTESDAYGAWHQYFGTTDYQGTSWKYEVRPAVRPVRAF